MDSIKKLGPEHEAQILGYLKSSRVEDGLLINFGSYRFEIRKFALSMGLARPHNAGLSAFLSAIFAIFAV